jgi:hypothetical protein
VPARRAGRGRRARPGHGACLRDPAPHHLVAAVVVAPPGDLRGLTHRELEILGLLVEGWTNARIATALVIAPRTAAIWESQLVETGGYFPVDSNSEISAIRRAWRSSPENGIARNVSTISAASAGRCIRAPIPTT